MLNLSKSLQIKQKLTWKPITPFPADIFYTCEIPTFFHFFQFPAVTTSLKNKSERTQPT